MDPTTTSIHEQWEEKLSTALLTPVDNSNSIHSLGSFSNLWETALSTIEHQITAHNFSLWFKPIRCEAIDENHITLIVPNRFIKDWFENHYLGLVLGEIQKQTKKFYEIIWLINDKLHWPIEPAALERPTELPLVAPLEYEGQCKDLLSKYTFQSFVVGPSNQLAEAASRAVGEHPADKYNPLFIYGGVGLGKTHLLHAIGHEIHKNHPDWKIVYLKTETFMNEYIHMVRNNRIDEFRTKYRQNPDVLLMDDIQYLGGKERTQDEFFHTFNSLFESRRQIVVTADKYPHEIPDLEERIRSRFQWGLIVDIQAPELETRMAILMKKAELDRIELPTDVAYYLASNIKSNVRELEGLLLRVAAFASLQKKDITVEFARDTLKNFISSSVNLTVEHVQKEVAEYFTVKISDLKSQSRQQTVARPRQIAMFLSRKLCKVSYPEIGNKFGGKDHTTVLSACRKVDELLKSDPKVAQCVAELERRLQ